MANTYITLRDTYLFLQDKRQAMVYTNKFVEISQYSPNPLDRALGYDLIAAKYEEVGQYSVALPYRKKSLILFQKTGSTLDVVYRLTCVATNLRHQNRFSESLVYLHEARLLGRRIKSYNDLGIIALELSQNHL